MNWLPTIGLEVHVQLATQSKIFSGAPTTFGAAPNTQACAVDLGLPGVLPVLNERAVRMAVRFGLEVGAAGYIVKGEEPGVLHSAIGTVVGGGTSSSGR